jgi:hypothetical protein
MQVRRGISEGYLWEIMSGGKMLGRRACLLALEAG